MTKLIDTTQKQILRGTILDRYGKPFLERFEAVRMAKPFLRTT